MAFQQLVKLIIQNIKKVSQSSYCCNCPQSKEHVKLVAALQFVQNTVENGFPRGFSNNYYRLKKENRLKPSRFEIEFICRDKRFCFGFSAILNSGNIIEEWLYELTASGIKKELYSRNVEE